MTVDVIGRCSSSTDCSDKVDGFALTNDFWVKIEKWENEAPYIYRRCTEDEATLRSYTTTSQRLTRGMLNKCWQPVSAYQQIRTHHVSVNSMNLPLTGWLVWNRHPILYKSANQLWQLKSFFLSHGSHSVIKRPSDPYAMIVTPLILCPKNWRTIGVKGATEDDKI